MSSSTVSLQTLTCRVDNHSWSRPAQAGRPPHTCPDHTTFGNRDGAPRTMKAPTLPTATVPPAPKRVKGQHTSFALLVAFLRQGLHVYAFGPSGSGKTKGTKNAAVAIFGEGADNTHFYGQSCHPLMNAEDLFGFMGPRGYMPGIVREWLSNPEGGILLLDEMDAANPALLVAINDILAIEPGESFRFPDGVRLERTANHVVVGAGNTNGLGATTDYAGRNNLDRATLNRFAFIDWDYDLSIERAMAGDDPIGVEWVSYCQRARAIALKNGLPLLITPRSVSKGADSLRAGIKRKDVVQAFILQGCDADTAKTLRTLLADDDAKDESNGDTCGTVCRFGIANCAETDCKRECTYAKGHEGSHSCSE